MTSKVFFGIDKSLEESLFEYGILMAHLDKKDHRGASYEVIYYKTEDDLFDFATITEEEIDKLLDEMGTKKGFLNYVSQTEGGWKKLPIQIKLHDLYSYYGYANVFGPSTIGYDKAAIAQYIEEATEESLMKKYNIQPEIAAPKAADMTVKRMLEWCVRAHISKEITFIPGTGKYTKTLDEAIDETQPASNEYNITSEHDIVTYLCHNTNDLYDWAEQSGVNVRAIFEENGLKELYEDK